MTAQQSQALHNQPGLNIDLSRMREAALHAQVHGAVFKASGSQVRQVLDYLHERTLEIKGLNARIAVLEAQQEVPHGWKLVPIEPTEAQLATVRSQKSHPCAPDRWDSNNRRIYMHMLAAAPLPPGDSTRRLTDGEIIAAQESLIATKDALYRLRIGLQCSRCKKGAYRADGNGYYDFHRCDSCRHVPMWGSDGKEFGIQEKSNGPTI